uniref:helix-turn-helix domain-containing protein n=1 Tax=Streptomyces scabiei TaxID=1930 RepID=UPI0013C46315
MSAAGDDVQRFAASLTRLKERTDRSYGQLARRLNMNTSTLHRYCAGGTVPRVSKTSRNSSSWPGLRRR